MFSREPSCLPGAHAMPVMQHLMSVFREQFGNGSDYAKLPNLNNTLVVMIQHGYPSVGLMMKSLLELGFDRRHIFMTTKPHTTSLEMLDYFTRNFEQYLPFQWPTNTEEGLTAAAQQSRYKFLTEVTHRKLFKNFCEYLFRYPKPGYIENIIICDEGGEFLKLFIELYNHPGTGPYDKKLSDYHVVAIEHTKCGTHGESLRRLRFPVIMMGDSFLKTQIESESIAESMFVYLHGILKPIVDRSSVIGIVGLGNIGKEVLGIILADYASVPIIIYDLETGVLCATTIIEQGLSNVSRSDSLASVFQQASIILGCTGKDITAGIPQEFFIMNPASHIHLISCSSGDREFGTVLQRMPDYKFEKLLDIRNFSVDLSEDKTRKLTVCNGGFPINFFVEGGVPAPETVPLEKIQNTRALKIASIAQALQLLDVIPYVSSKQERALTGYIKLDVNYQWEIYRALINSASSAQQVYYQRKFSALSKKDIAEGSIGEIGPSMSSVLGIPYYIATNFQIRMQNQLAKQDSPVKILLIQGTAGSGKTTLGKHYLYKQQIAHPEHINKMLFAETEKQWWSSLREWGEELCPDLNERLRRIQDVKEQKKVMISHIQAVLRKTVWCVVIDNWDHRNLRVSEIDKMFRQGNVGSGDLLITTQLNSQEELPFADQNESLDLSFGFAPKESLNLLIKVMNLNDTLFIDWQVLGSEAELQSLTNYLNHLPLSLVIAGSYLLWENKSRQRRGEPWFTYSDYQQLVQQHVEELKQVYDEKLGNKSNIPREDDREEFICVKTQEAAIDLSLKKAIQPESLSPHMSLWHLLCFCGFIASDAIPQQLLQDCLHRLVEISHNEIESSFNSVIEAAQQYSLLQFENRYSAVDGARSIHIHRVVQHVLQESYWSKLLLKTKKSELNMRGLMRQSFEDNFGLAVREQSFPIIRAYLSHVVAWSKYWKKISMQETVEFAELELYNIWAIACHRLGDSLQAKTLFQEMLVTLRSIYTEDSLSVALVRQSLAGILEHFGDYTGAHELYQQTLVDVLACENEDVTDSQQNLASSLMRLGDYSSARKIFEQSLSEKLIRHGRRDCVEVAQVIFNYATCLQNLDDPVSAYQLYQEALRIYISHYGLWHIALTGIQSNLGGLLIDLGDYEGARDLYQASFDIRTAHYGEQKHIDIATSGHNLAIILNHFGDYTAARILCEKSLEIKKAHYKTEDHVEVAKTKHLLAETLNHLGEHSAARVYYLQVLKTTEKFYDVAHIEVAKIKQGLAVVLRSLGDYQGACDLFSEVLDTKKLYFGDDHIEVAKLQHHLAVSLYQLNLYLASRTLLEQALKTTIAHYQTESHIDVAEIQQNLATALRELGDKVSARKFYQNALATYEKESHKHVARTQYKLVMVLIDMNEMEEALFWLLKCEKTFETQPEYSQNLSECRKIKQSLQKKMHLSFLALSAAVSSKNLAKLQQLLELKTPIHSSNIFTGSTPLHIAVAEEYEEGVILLMSYGANPYQQDNEGISSLAWASFLGLINIERYLNGINPVLNMATSEKVIEPIVDWQGSCSTLFGYQYRFFMEKTSDRFTLTRTDQHIETSAERHLLERVRLSCMFFLRDTTHSKETINVIRSTDDSFTLQGNQEAQTLAYTVLSEIANENISDIGGCSIS